MGFLRKAFKKVKKGIKKVVRGIKKVVKKISKSKILKTIALVGAAIVTGGAAVGAFGGQLASSTMGTWLVEASKNILATPVIGTLAKPFEMLGAAVGTGAGKVTDFLGVTDKAARLINNDPTKAVEILERAGVSKDIIGQMTAQQNLDLAKAYIDVQGGTGALQAQTLAQATGQALPEGVAATFSPASVTSAAQTSSNLLGRIGTGIQTGLQLASDVGSVYQQFQDPVQQGYAPGQAVEGPSVLDPLQIYYAQPAVNISDAYSNLQYGTADPGYLAANLYRQETVGGMA
jgi:hypothetical protein